MGLFRYIFSMESNDVPVASYRLPSAQYPIRARLAVFQLSRECGVDVNAMIRDRDIHSILLL